MLAVRMEKDLLGEKEVPVDAYYGIQTIRAMENFPITGYTSHPSLIKAMAMVKKAAALTNMELELLDTKIGKAIVEASEEIMEGGLADQFLVDVIQGGAGTSINMNTNEVIANRAAELLGGKKGDYHLVSPNSHVNMAQSTNDVVPTAIRICLLKLVKALYREIEDLVASFQKKSHEFDEVVKIGRTHLQDAVPILLGQEFAAYASALKRDLKRINFLADDLTIVNLGATAVGTGLNAKKEYIVRVVELLNEITGLPLKNADDLVDATQNTDGLAAFSGGLKFLALNLIKIANDLRIMASGPRGGLSEINLPPMQPGSSIMPGKVNPVMPEVINQIAFQVIGNDQTVGLAVQAGQLELNVMEPVMVFNLVQSLTILTNGLRVFREKCIDGITANTERCLEMVERSVGIITALNPYLGYEKSSQLAQEVLASKRMVAEIVEEKGLLTKEELATILSPKAMTAPGRLLPASKNK